MTKMPFGGLPVLPGFLKGSRPLSKYFKTPEIFSRPLLTRYFTHLFFTRTEFIRTSSLSFCQTLRTLNIRSSARSRHNVFQLWLTTIYKWSLLEMSLWQPMSRKNWQFRNNNKLTVLTASLSQGKKIPMLYYNYTLSFFYLKIDILGESWKVMMSF